MIQNYRYRVAEIGLVIILAIVIGFGVRWYQEPTCDARGLVGWRACK